MLGDESNNEEIMLIEGCDTVMGHAGYMTQQVLVLQQKPFNQ